MQSPCASSGCEKMMPLARQGVRLVLLLPAHRLPPAKRPAMGRNSGTTPVEMRREKLCPCTLSGHKIPSSSGTDTSISESNRTHRDKLARLLHDRVTTLAPNVDGLVLRLSTSYDQRGHIATLTSADNPTPGKGNIVNEVAYEYNGIDCLTSDAQSHGGAVDGSTPKVQYQCSAATGGVLRRTGVIYPSGRALNYEYGTSGSIDDVLNRVQSVHDDDLTVLGEPSDRTGNEIDQGEAGTRRVRRERIALSNQFQYVGLAMPSVTTLPEPEVQRRWKKLSSESNGDAGDPYTGYDRFGRWIHMRWFKQDTTPLALVDVKWGYNRASLKTWRQDVLATSLSAAQDQYFTYDGLYQVNDRQLGRLNGSFTGITGAPAQEEGFGYDETGNWVTYEQENCGTLDIDQTRENNESNQITEIDSVSTAVAYDANGNMLKVPTGGAALDGTPHKLIWDAWNRLRKVTDDADNLLAEYQYDTITRRTISTIAPETRHYYYNDQWRRVEERLGSSVNTERQHIWHPTDRWELLLRDRSTANNGTMDERLYCMKDQFDPVAVCDAAGAIVERYAYSAFGLPVFLEDDFSPLGGNVSAVAWDFLFHAEFADELTGWFNYGYRHYVTALGRWPSRDPIGEDGGANLYGMVGNGVVNWVDILGLQASGTPPCCTCIVRNVDVSAIETSDAQNAHDADTISDKFFKLLGKKGGDRVQSISYGYTWQVDATWATVDSKTFEEKSTGVYSMTGSIPYTTPNNAIKAGDNERQTARDQALDHCRSITGCK